MSCTPASCCHSQLKKAPLFAIQASRLSDVPRVLLYCCNSNVTAYLDRASRLALYNGGVQAREALTLTAWHARSCSGAIQVPNVFSSHGHPVRNTSVHMPRTCSSPSFPSNGDCRKTAKRLLSTRVRGLENGLQSRS